MKVQLLTAMAGAALITAAAPGGIISALIDPTPFGNLADGEKRAELTSSAPVRAFYITGTWNPTSGTSHWSIDMRIRPLLNGAFFPNPTTGHQMQGGASNNAPFTYMHPGATWNNTTRGGFLFGALGGPSHYTSGGNYDFNFRTGFGQRQNQQKFSLTGEFFQVGPPGAATAAGGARDGQAGQPGGRSQRPWQGGPASSGEVIPWAGRIAPGTKSAQLISRNPCFIAQRRGMAGGEIQPLRWAKSFMNWARTSHPLRGKAL